MSPLRPLLDAVGLRRPARVLRHALRDLALDLDLARRRRDRASVEAWLRSAPKRRVHLGCGPRRLEGWLNVDLVPGGRDVVRADARALPLPDGCADLAYTEHVLEHLDEAGAPRCSASCAASFAREGG